MDEKPKQIRVVCALCGDDIETTDRGDFHANPGNDDHTPEPMQASQ